MATNAIRCPLCAYQVLRLQQLVSHLRLVHSGDPNFELVCGIGGCRQRFGAFSAFNSHVYRFHRAALGLSDEQLMPSDEENLPSNSQEAEGIVSDMNMDCDSCGIEPPAMRFAIPHYKALKVLNDKRLLRNSCLD